MVTKHLPILAAGLLLAVCCLRQSGAAEADLTAMTRAGLVDLGESLRLHRVFAKAAAGQAVTLAYIGGSITAGTGASKGKAWPDQVTAWWKSTWPASEVRHRNAGIGATGSFLGTFRVQSDVLTHHPDVVFVEFSFNDTDSTLHVETMEGMLRQILAAPGAPAVVMLCQCDDKAVTVQEGHAALAKHYGLPVVSFRDAVLPQIRSGTLTWKDLLPDTIHPNDRGHTLAAALVTEALEQHRALFLSNPVHGEPTVLPAPFRSDIYAINRTWTPASLKPARLAGWTIANNEWRSETPGAELVLQVAGERIGLEYWKIHGAQGRITVTVDDRAPVILDTFYDLTWGGLWRIDDLGGPLPPGPHQVRIRVAQDKHADSTGHQIRIRAVRAAGPSSRAVR